MPTIVSGFFKPTGELHKNFPYMNASGLYYSELEGSFTPYKYEDTDISDAIVVRGLFDMETYDKGKRTGFQVILEETKQQKKGMTVYNSGDRSQAYQNIDDEQLRDALIQIVHGVGETYAERLIWVFNTKGLFFEELDTYIRTDDSTKNMGVPDRLLKAVLDSREDIEQAIETLITDESYFYNTLNHFNLVSFSSSRSFPFQQSIKQWKPVFRYISLMVNHKEYELPTALRERTGDYGRHVTYLMAHPEIILQLSGDPMTQTMKQVKETIAVTRGVMEMTGHVVDDATFELLGLGDTDLFSYALELTRVLKNHKDGSFNGPHADDTMFLFTEAMHKEAVQSGGFSQQYDDIKAVLQDTEAYYPVIVFPEGEEFYIQFRPAHDRNDTIVSEFSRRLSTGNEPFVDTDLYEQGLQEVIESLGEQQSEDEQIHLDPAQIDALKGLNNHSISVLTGGPGTGKTTMLKYFLSTLTRVSNDLFEEGSHKIVFCAPTGKASKRMRESLNDDSYTEEFKALRHIQDQTYTVHSFLGEKYSTVREEARGDEQGSRWLIIDEASMLDEVLLEAILRKIPKSYRLVFIGDDEQLPSIGAGAVLRDLKTLTQAGQFHLNQPFRSKGTIMKNTYTIRNKAQNDEYISVEDLHFDGRFSITDYPLLTDVHKKELVKDEAYLSDVQRQVPDLNSAYGYSGWVASFLYYQYRQELLDIENSLILMPFSKKGSGKRLAVTPFNQVIQGISRPFRGSLPQSIQLESYQTISGALNKGEGETSLFELNKKLFKKYGAGSGFSVNNSAVFRVGDRVMNTKNKYQLLTLDVEKKKEREYTLEDITTMWYGRLQEKDLFSPSTSPIMNGDIGTVRAITRDGGMFVQFDSMDGETDIEHNPWVYYNRQDVENKGDSLALSYSMTIHKSQGSQADTVVICLPDASDITTMSYRELFYTALTRAKDKVVILGSKTVLEDALNRSRSNRTTRLSRDFQSFENTLAVNETA